MTTLAMVWMTDGNIQAETGGSSDDIIIHPETDGRTCSHAPDSLVATAWSLARDFAFGALSKGSHRILGPMEHPRPSVVCLQENREVAGQDLCSTWTMPGLLPDKCFLKIEKEGNGCMVRFEYISSSGS